MMHAVKPIELPLYRLLRPLLFRLDPERVHDLTFALLRGAYRLPGFPRLLRRGLADRTPALPVTVMGLRFPNPIGLAAGLDKSARHLGPLFALGFGWLELGTVTPRAQTGNPKKRLFRVPEHAAIINRMGFNNPGTQAFLDHLRAQRTGTAGIDGIIGINIGKNRDTPMERAVDDYLSALRAVHAFADYVAINVSSPNTAQLRELQEGESLERLLSALQAEQARLAHATQRSVPLALKIAPDLSDEQLTHVAALARRYRVGAVIATNTTVTRPGLEHTPYAAIPGGLSGAPLKGLSTAVIRKLYTLLRGEVPIVGVGGIATAADAWEKLVAGADLVQIYTALIYRGPGMVRELLEGLAVYAGGVDLAQAVARARNEALGNSSKMI